MNHCRFVAFAMLVAGILAFMPAARAGVQQSSSDSSQSSNPEIVAVALSYDGQHLAWLGKHGKNTTLMLASPSGRHAHAVTIPGHCRTTGLRWARRWSRLAILTACGAGASGQIRMNRHSVIWVMDVHAGKTPQKVATVRGYVHGMQWTSGDKRIAFLQAPSATQVPTVSLTGDKNVAGQRVVSVPAKGGTASTLTPDDEDVYAFRWSPFGNRIVYVAASHGTDRNQARLYVQRTDGDTGPDMIVDPGDSNGVLHDRHIVLPRWSPSSGTIVFLGVRNGDHAGGGHLYRVSSSGGTPVDLMPGSAAKPAWFRFLGKRSLLVSQRADGKVQVVLYRLYTGHTRQVASFFSLSGAIGDGRGPLAVSLGWWRHRHSQDRRRIAFVHTMSGKPAELRSGRLMTAPPPVIESARADTVSSAASSPAAASRHAR